MSSSELVRPQNRDILACKEAMLRKITRPLLVFLPIVNNKMTLNQPLTQFLHRYLLNPQLTTKFDFSSKSKANACLFTNLSKF